MTTYTILLESADGHNAELSVDSSTRLRQMQRRALHYAMVHQDTQTFHRYTIRDSRGKPLHSARITYPISEA